MVELTTWNRRHRRQINKWPETNLPKLWLKPRTESKGLRQSWAIVEKGTGELVGRLTIRDHNNRSCRLGIYLHPERLGQGFGRLAITAFQQLQIVDEIHLDVASDNLRAIRCYIACGFRVVDLVGQYVEMVWSNGKSISISDFSSNSTTSTQ
jgi:RimJ/RimL family protein N-acetyltransferase